MQIEMSFKGMDSSDRLKEFTRDKTERLHKFFEGKFHARWTFSNERHLYQVGVRLTGQDLDEHVESESGNLFTVVEEAVEKLERILQKNKEVARDHRRG